MTRSLDYIRIQDFIWLTDSYHMMNLALSRVR